MGSTPDEIEGDNAAGRPVVLVVDDSDDICFLLRLELEAAGYVVETTSDGTGALAALRRRRSRNVDLIITDGLMPTMSGPELILVVRTDPRLRAIPVIGMDALPLEEWHKRWGVDPDWLAAFIDKPFNVNTVVELVAELLADRPGGTGSM